MQLFLIGQAHSRLRTAGRPDIFHAIVLWVILRNAIHHAIELCIGRGCLC